jgi:hypothetical protein
MAWCAYQGWEQIEWIVVSILLIIELMMISLAPHPADVVQNTMVGLAIMWLSCALTAYVCTSPDTT